MLEGLAQGIATLFQPAVLFVLFVGTLISLSFGVIPGLSGLVACALALPFLFRMPPEIALSILIALHASSPTGGSISAILLNIPGVATSVATLLDGFPMNQKGEGSRAIGAAVTSSMAGGVVGVPLTLIMIPLILPIIIAFKSPEMCFLVVVGLVFIGVLTTGAAIKGVISGALGLMAGLIGMQISTGVPRFTFGLIDLYEGLGIVPVCLGLFALPQIIDMIMKGQASISQVPVKTKMKDTLQGVKDVYIHWWLWLRSSIIGHIIGVIPGVGPETAIWVCYGQAKQTSKHPEKFGTGCVEGVIAPESANNAKEAGALLTTMAFGIPGSTIMAIFLGAFMMVGVTPGPRMLIDHLPLAFTLLLGIVVANIMGGVIAFFGAPYLAKVGRVHIHFLFPAILVIIFVGSFAMTESLVSIVIVVVFAIIGFIMMRHGYSRPALLLGFVLGGLFERYFFLSLHIFGPLFFLRPICLVLIAMIFGVFGYPYIGKVFSTRFKLKGTKNED